MADRKLRGVQNVRTTRALFDARRVKSAAGALMELAALATERQRLQAEIDRRRRREAEIQTRLAEIADRETRLLQVVANRLPGDVPASAPPDVPVAPPVRGLVTRELDY